MSLDDSTRQKITDLIEQNRVLLFMKGDRSAPQCGFSARVIEILEGYGAEYETLDVLSNADVREGIKVYSSWPTIPQLYVGGEFIGGCDIITEMHGTGELFEPLGVEPPPAVTPEIHLTAEAADALGQAAAQSGGPGQHLHLSISPSFQSTLSMAPQSPMDVVVETSGVTLMVDRLSAARANGVTISLVETQDGRGFKVDNPNAPQVQTMSVQSLKELIEAGEPFELLDVRTPEEYETARLEQAQLVDQRLFEHLQTLPRDTRLVFLCHHGPRGVQAAEQFLSMGFTDVHNVAGGLHAWSQEIDPSVPQY
ncbi:MAG: Grx4 family monothiol glutaredoxin [Myxococcota bacterium]|nr:Grx4 family monothiol glutaredoxin [Myxococcota bacterium]